MIVWRLREWQKKGESQLNASPYWQDVLSIAREASAARAALF